MKQYDIPKLAQHIDTHDPSKKSHNPGQQKLP